MMRGWKDGGGGEGWRGGRGAGEVAEKVMEGIREWRYERGLSARKGEPGDRSAMVCQHKPNLTAGAHIHGPPPLSLSLLP